MNGTDWLPGILTLTAALALAAGYVFFSLRRAKPAGQQEEAQKRSAELDARYQTAIQQLRELKAEQSKLTPEAYEAQRAELEKRAADALRAKETQAPSPAPAQAAVAAATAPKGFFARHPQLVGAMWGGGVVAFFGVLGILLFKEAKPKSEGPMERGPMQQAQGGGPQESGGDELAQAMERLREHPEDADTAAMVGHELIRRQEWVQAAEITARALGADPFHVENRIHRAVMKTQRGDPAGEAELQHLADTYPGAQEALLFLASAQAQAGDKAKALENLERYVSVAPPEEQSIELYQAMAQFRRELGRPPAP
jgi:tetratricopeptide (TPR) repeat protein